MIKRFHFPVRSVKLRFACYRALATARRDSLARLARPGVGRVLVICYGNIYRSAFVGGYFAQRPLPGIEFRSAGLHPVIGRPSPARHVELCQRYGVDLSAHRSAVLSHDNLAWAELIVLMDRHNWQALIERGAARERLVWLGALDGGAIEIADPYRMDDTAAAHIVERLSGCTERLAAQLGNREV